MIIKDLNLSSFSREAYINLIVIILNSFLLDYEYFTNDEKEIIANVLLCYQKEVENFD